MENRLYFKYWGKVAKSDPDDYHLLPYHCLDVAAVGWILLQPEGSLCKRMAEQLGVQPNLLRDFFIFCLALHDLGKFSRAFQGVRSVLSFELVKANPRMRYSERHDTLGFWLWNKELYVRLEKEFLGNGDWLAKSDHWMEIVTGHHGMPPKKSGGRLSDFFEPEDQDAAAHFVRDTYNLFLGEFDHDSFWDKVPKQKLRNISWQLAGIAVLADWLGSNQQYFKYQSNPEELTGYWRKRALPSAESVIQSMPAKPESARFQGVGNLFPFIEKPTPLQEYAINELLNDKPQLFILEDVTGAGKTEAAMILSQRLIGEGLADGLYVALPTMATANAMYQRLSRVYRRFYVGSGLPSLILAHGARDLSDAFRDSVILPENQAEDFCYAEGSRKQEQELTASAYCNAWIADNRKKALLADVGVGTLDQTLLAVLPARHQSLRLLGLGRKILLVDEVHAYDSYMQKLLDALIEIHARQGGSVILLSATLPKTMREKLSAAFHRGTGEAAPEISSDTFPLATHSSAGENHEKHIDTREEVKRTVRIEHLKTEEEVMERIREGVSNGQCVCWIRNTVKAARASYRFLANCGWLNRDHLSLFHSRFAMVDRQRIETDTVARFGETSAREQREGQVLIATQVVEQSLDLDFDLLITDLAPVDLIIQRAGRQCRHIRDEHGNRLRGLNAIDGRGTPVLYLFSPDPRENIDSNWLKSHQKGTQAVYPHIGRLWLTAKLLLIDQKGKFTMPDDARCLIEEVYSPGAADNIPDALKKDSFKAIGEDQSRKSMADFNALKLNKGYTRSSGDWDEETRMPTRLTEEDSISVALACLKEGRLLPYANTEHHQWPMSVVKLPEREWLNARQQIPATMRSLIEELKTEEKALRWLEVFPLADETAIYYNSENGWQPETGEEP